MLELSVSSIIIDDFDLILYYYSLLVLLKLVSYGLTLEN